MEIPFYLARSEANVKGIPPEFYAPPNNMLCTTKYMGFTSKVDVDDQVP